MQNLGLAWLEIDLDAVGHNVSMIKKVVGKNCEIMAIVKANAYGYDAVEVSRVALKNGATRLGVALLEVVTMAISIHSHTSP